jgi:hypothetical protein
MQSSVTFLVSANEGGTNPANGDCRRPLVSSDAHWVIFESEATDIVPNDLNGFSDVFVRDLQAGRTIRLSTALDAQSAADALSTMPALSPDRGTVAFLSFASNLTGDDFNQLGDVVAVRLDTEDSDRDGLPDEWEKLHFEDLTQHATDDPDQDGLINRAELRAGTNPKDAESVLRLLGVTPTRPAGVELRWSAVPGKVYQVQVKNRLNDSEWLELDAPVTASSDIGRKILSAPAGAKESYYRVLLVD